MLQMTPQLHETGARLTPKLSPNIIQRARGPASLQQSVPVNTQLLDIVFVLLWLKVVDPMLGCVLYVLLTRALSLCVLVLLM